MSRKRKCYEMDKVEYVPPLKKRRLSTTPPLSPHRYQNNRNHNQKLSQYSSQFSCAESSQHSQFSQFSQFSHYSQSSQDSSHRQGFFSDSLPDVLLQEILSYNTPFELSVCSVVNKFYNLQCQIMWQRLNKCCISPHLFPSLIEDDYDSQFEYNPARHPHRTHFTLNWIINKKLNQCINLQHLKIQRTMISGAMFQVLIKNCSNLLTLHLDENPWIFLLGNNNNTNNNSMDIDNIDNNEMYTANLFDSIEYKPSFKLQSFIIESMYMNMTDITFNRLLLSSTQTLQTLILKKRDPFKCSYCHKKALCKWHKCEDCELRSYCSTKCQSDDWWQHQYVCSYHQNNNNNNRLNGAFLDTICSFKNLHTLDLTWCWFLHDTALTQISLSCPNLENIILNGCDVCDEGIIALSNNLKIIRKLHCRSARYVTDISMDILANQHADNLIDLDISRCCRITKECVLNIINKCEKIINLSIACGIKRGGWIWTLDDNMVNDIIRNLKKLKHLQYLSTYHNNTTLSIKNEQRLFNINGIKIEKISTDKQTELRNENGHLRVAFVNEYSQYNNPVLMKYIVNGTVVYQHRFKR